MCCDVLCCVMCVCVRMCVCVPSSRLAGRVSSSTGLSQASGGRAYARVPSINARFVHPQHQIRREERACGEGEVEQRIGEEEHARALWSLEELLRGVQGGGKVAPFGDAETDREQPTVGQQPRAGCRAHRT